MFPLSVAKAFIICDHINTKWQQHCHPPTWLAHSKRQFNSARPQSGCWRDRMLSVRVHNPRQSFGGVSYCLGDWKHKLSSKNLTSENDRDGCKLLCHILSASSRGNSIMLIQGQTVWGAACDLCMWIVGGMTESISSKT